MTKRVLALFLILVADTIYLTIPVCPKLPHKVNLNRGQAIRGSRASVSMEVCVESPVGRGKSIHDQLSQTLHQLGTGVYAYRSGRLAELGIDVVEETEFIDYPGQYSGTTRKDWETGKSSARYWVLRLLRENFAPGNKAVESRDRAFDIGIPEGTDVQVEYGGQTTSFDPRRKTMLQADRVSLPGLAAAVVTLAM
jgi:hypothetical protein